MIYSGAPCTADNWWLSSRNNTSNSRNVNTDGTLNRNNAYNGNNGLRPASMDRSTY